MSEDNEGGGQNAIERAAHLANYWRGFECNVRGQHWLAGCLQWLDARQIAVADLERVVADEHGVRFQGGARRLTVTLQQPPRDALDEADASMRTWLEEMQQAIERGVIAAFREDAMHLLPSNDDRELRQQTVIFVLGVRDRDAERAASLVNGSGRNV